MTRDAGTRICIWAQGLACTVISWSSLDWVSRYAAMHAIYTLAIELAQWHGHWNYRLSSRKTLCYLSANWQKNSMFCVLIWSTYCITCPCPPVQSIMRIVSCGVHVAGLNAVWPVSQLIGSCFPVDLISMGLIQAHPNYLPTSSVSK